jgi:UDP-glucose 4-epimerase
VARHLVTGGAGFIGSHLAQRLVASGDEVVALDDLSTGSTTNVAPLIDRPGFRLVIGCASDRALVDRLVAGCDTVFHLASAVGVDLILEHPLPSLESNVLSSLAVLDAAARHCRPLILASSSEVYGYHAPIPSPEDASRDIGSASDVRSSYAAAKALSESLAIAHVQAHRLHATIVRVFNTTGPRQRPEQGVLPRFVQAALAGRPLRVLGDGSQTRCFAHVADVVDALHRLSRLPRAPGEIYNVGSQEEVTMLALAQRIVRATGAGVPIDIAGYRDGFREPLRRIPDTRKLTAATGWRPAHELDAVIGDVIDAARGTLRLGVAA